APRLPPPPPPRLRPNRPRPRSRPLRPRRSRPPRNPPRLRPRRPTARRTAPRRRPRTTRRTVPPRRPPSPAPSASGPAPRPLAAATDAVTAHTQFGPGSVTPIRGRITFRAFRSPALFGFLRMARHTTFEENPPSGPTALRRVFEGVACSLRFPRVRHRNCFVEVVEVGSVDPMPGAGGGGQCWP